MKKEAFGLQKETEYIFTVDPLWSGKNRGTKNLKVICKAFRGSLSIQLIEIAAKVFLLGRL